MSEKIFNAPDDRYVADRIEHKKILVEFDPPFDTDFSLMIEGARRLCECGADFITIADSPLGKARADAAMSAVKLKRELGISVLPHLSCRDRNRISIKGALIGLHVEGIRNVLAVTGDPVPHDGTEVKSVFDKNSFGLTEYISGFNGELFVPRISVGGALNINVLSFEHELRRAQKKIGVGVEFFLTQPVFSDGSEERVAIASETLGVPVFAGIMPIVSKRNALFLNKAVKGIHISDEVVESFEGLEREEGYAHGAGIAFDTVMRLWDKCFGFYLVTPMNKVDIMCDIVKKIRSFEQGNAQRGLV